MYCYKCGEKLDDDARFCTSCGTKVEEEPQAGAVPAAGVPVQPWTAGDMAEADVSARREEIEAEEEDNAEETKIIGQLPHKYNEEADKVEHVNTEEASKPERVFSGNEALTVKPAEDASARPDTYTQPGTYGQSGQYGPAGTYSQENQYGPSGVYGQENQYGQVGAYGQESQYGQAGAYDQENQYGQSGVYGAGNQYGHSGAYDQGNQYGQSGAYGSGNQYGQSGVYGAGNQYGHSGAYDQGNQYGQPGAYGPGNQYGQSGAYGQGNQYGQPGSYDQSGQGAYSQRNAFGQGKTYGQQAMYGQKGSGKHNNPENPQGYMPQDKPRKGIKGGVLALIIIGAILICGGIGFLVWSFTGGKSTPEKTISKLEDAFNNKDLEAVVELCDSTSAGLLKIYVGAGAESLIDEIYRGYDNFSIELTVKDITYEGDEKCIAEVKAVIRANDGPEKEDIDIPLVKEKGKWKIDLTGTLMDGIF